jgi:hypothetical protein
MVHRGGDLMTKLTLAASLWAILVGGFVMAAPADPPPPHRRPPEEAFTACASAQEGDACTVTLPNHEVHGTCMKVPADVEGDAGKLFCRPPHPPHPPTKN